MKTRNDLVPGYGTSSRIAEIQAIVEQGFLQGRPRNREVAPYSVINRRGSERRQTGSQDQTRHALEQVATPSQPISRTTRPHGKSGDELERMQNTLHILNRTGLRCLWVVLGDALLDLPEHEAREVVRSFTSRIVKEQDKARLPQYWLRVHESTGGFHSNLIFPATKDMRAAILRWEEFKDYLRGKKAVQWAYDLERLGRVYLGKERVPFAKGGGKFAPRMRGSHRLGEGGGDRVQLSRALQADAVAAGIVQHWQRTKSKILVPSKPEIITPPGHAAVARAIAYAEASEPEIRVGVSEVHPESPVQLPLFGTLPERRYLQPADLRLFRQMRGHTQAEISKWAGIRNRSHVANFERGHDGLSLQRQRLVRHMMDTQRMAA